MEKRNRYKRIIITIVILLIFVSIFGLSYALNTKKETEYIESIILTDEVLNINYLNGKEYDIKEFNKDDTFSKKVSVTNISNDDVYITISLMDVEKNSDDLSLIVVDKEGKTVYDNKITNIDTEVIKTIPLPAKTTISYTFMVKNNGETTYFSADLLAYKEVIATEKNNFKETLLKNNIVKTATTTPGTNESTTKEGLIKTKDDQGDAYYFRGAIDNNYVKFANQMWRIVRINGNGSVRLVLNDILSETVAYNSDTEETDNYTDKLLFNNSTIKEKLDAWLTTLGENSKYITNSVFCEDINILTEEGNIKYLNTYNRIFQDENPTLMCLGNKIETTIGLLTADEVTLAGAYKKNSNTSYFLYNDAITDSWWTLSGSQILESNNVVDAISVNKDGSLNYEKKISTTMGIRPVISFDVNTTVIGSGTQDDPYIIQ